MRRRLVLSITSLTTAIAACGLAPSLAAAAGSPARRPASPAARASARLYVQSTYTVGRDSVTVPGRAFSVAGVVSPYVPGQRVRVKTAVGRRLVKTDRLAVKPSRNGRLGLFTETLRSPAAGLVRVTVTHARTRQMLGFIARRAVAALNPRAGFGAHGLFVGLIQQRLLAQHIYLPASGAYDTQMGLALDAYHRLLGRGASQQLDEATISALLDSQGSFHVRHPGDGKHVEANLSQQLLAEVYGAKVYRIYPISSGKPSTPTIVGHFRVYQRDPGYLPDGMYYSSFFSGGYAIHGYSPAPDYPASHGCMRLPIIDAVSVYNWVTYGDVVDVYR